MPQTKRVCIIGAGPSGMSALFHFNKLKAEGKVIPETVCFEKQSDWGGLWNYTWQSGTDEFGEPVHGSMYRGLWSNGPKECLEFPDYTFEEHFGKAIPSYPPRPVLFDYLKGRWSKGGLRHFIRFNHVVRYVSYNDSTDDFTVTVKNLPEDKEFAQTFDYVIVANGHFSTPNMPTFPGIDQFPGRVMHGHEFRNSSQFKGKRLLLVGASYSAEDIALQCLKYGAESIICTWRTKPMGFKWPAKISEKPLLTMIEGNTVHFKDGTSAEVDDIIFCTGYHLYFPFMEECLRLKSRNVLFPVGLYKAILWRHGGNNKVLYMGMVDQYYSFTLFDAQAHWAAKYIMGDLALPDKEAMERDCKKWLDRLQEMKGCDDDIDYQTDYLADITKDSSYGYDLDTAKHFHDWEENKRKNIATYRDHSHTSKFTGTKSPMHRDPFMKAFDDSIQNFVGR